MDLDIQITEKFKYPDCQWRASGTAYANNDPLHEKLLPSCKSRFDACVFTQCKWVAKRIRNLPAEKK
jgi:hypothetical protein